MIGFAQLIADNGWFWTTILGLSVGVIVFVCALRRSDLAPLAVMASVPIQRELLIGQVAHHITYTQICLAGFFAGALILFVGGRLRVRLDPLSLLSIAVGCLDGLSILAGGEQGNWAGENYRWWVSIGFFIVGRSYFDQRSIIRLKRFIIVMVGVGATWALIQIGSDAGPANFSRNGLTRAFGGFGEPNPFAAFMVAITLMVIPVAYSQWATPDGHRQALAACAVAVAILSVFATQSRGGLLGLATGVVVLGLSAGLSSGERSKRVTIITLAIGMSVLIPATVVLAPWTELAREVTVANWAEQERAAHWAAAIAMIERHPWFGVGAGEFSDSFRAYTTEWRFRISRGHAHNAYLQMAAEVGIPALCAYVSFLALMVGKLIAYLRAGRSSWLIAGALAVTIAMITHGMFDYLNVLSLGLMYSGIWAASLAIAQRDLSTGEHHIAL